MGFLSLPDKWRDEDDESGMNVSVLVATYGDDSWYELADERAVASARAQTDNVQHLHVRTGLSLAQARNALGRIATGDWLCFLDGDDELEPGYLDAMEQGYIHDSSPADLDHLGSGTIAPRPLLVPKVRRVAPYARAGWQEADIPNKGGWPKVNECVIGTLVARSVFEAVGGFRDHTDDGTAIDLYEDWDLWLRCYDAGAKLVYTDAVYREHINPSGRNYSPAPSATYDAIWRDHEARIA